MSISSGMVPTGEWVGFFVDFRHPQQRGWMQMYLEFENNEIRGEGTDFVGPWQINGDYELTSNRCRWIKKYVGLHTVEYRGLISDQGIIGDWNMMGLSDRFHIWPKSLTHLQENYMEQDLEQPQPNFNFGTPDADRDWRSLTKQYFAY